MRLLGLPTRFFETIAGAMLLAFPLVARADGCGTQLSPDYEAERIVTVGNSTDRITVYVSGPMIREEKKMPDGLRVTIRDLRSGRTIVLNPGTGRSTTLPMPPRPIDPSMTRTLTESGPGDTRVYVVQIQRSGRWLELSRTGCRADGIMTQQSFISLDPQGHEVEGVIRQDQIKIGPLSPNLFQIPP